MPNDRRAKYFRSEGIGVTNLFVIDFNIQVKLFMFCISNNYITFASVKCSELLKLLKNNGWYKIRQSGSHVIMKHPEKNGTLPVPFHGSKDVKKGLLKAILKQANIKTDKR